KPRSMSFDHEHSIIQQCLRRIEHQLGWGESSSWSTQDFESLSGKIQTATGVNLSVATLKRIWGKIKYESRPTVTTLDALARYSGYESWRAFRQSVESAPALTTSPGNDIRPKRSYRLFIGAAGLIAAVGSLIFFARGKETAPPY